MGRRNAIVQPMGLACILAMGAGVAVALLVYWAVLIGEQLVGREPVTRSFVVTQEGTPFVVSYGGFDFDKRSYQTLDGREVSRSEVWSSLPSTWFRWPDRRQTAAEGLDWVHRIAGFRDLQQPETLWYFVHNGDIDGSGYFVGFDRDSKVPVGCLGLEGFSPDKPPAGQWFPVDGSLMAAMGAFQGGNLAYGRKAYPGGFYRPVKEMSDFDPWIGHMISGRQILRLDFRARTHRVVLELPDALGLNTLYVPVPGKDKQEETAFTYRRALAIRTRDAILAMTPSTGQREAYVLPPALRESTFSWYQLRDGKFLAIASKYLGPEERSDLYWFDVSGKVLRHEKVIWERQRSFLENPRSAAWTGVLATPAPVAAVFGVPAAHARENLELGSDPGYPRALVRAIGQTWPQLLLVGLVSAGTAWLCYRRQKQFALPGTAWWVAFVFLGGVPGLLGYLLHRRWPPLVACPACAEPTPRDRDHCAHCRAEFAPPTPKGIEVLAA